MSVVMWVLVAVLAGLLAGFVMKRGSYGRGWDVILGLIGGVVVSWALRAPVGLARPGPGRDDLRRGRRRGGPDCRAAHDLSRTRLGKAFTWIDPSRRVAPESDQRRDHEERSQRWTRIEEAECGTAVE